MQRNLSRKVLTQTFFQRPAVEVAEDLLGKILVRRIGGKLSRSVITEVEAYVGPQDRACHASRGLTRRNVVMFGPAGYFYVYFVYGMYWMLNVVTGEEGFPAAVLIRGIKAYDGPGKLTKRLSIDGRLNAKIVAPRSGLWFEDGGATLLPKDIVRLPRVGVAYAGAWAKKPLRFLLK